MGYMEPMKFGYINGNAKRSTASQRAALKAFGVEKIWCDEKGSHEDFNHLTAKRSGIGRGDVRYLAVAEFHLLATGRKQLLERVNLVHGYAVFIIEASTGRNTESHVALADMLAEAEDFYRTGLRKAEREKIGKRGGEARWAKPNSRRMPDSEALIYLCDMNLSINQAIAAINADRRYKVPWTRNYAYVRKKRGELKFPDRAAGRRVKPAE